MRQAILPILCGLLCACSTSPTPPESSKGPAPENPAPPVVAQDQSGSEKTHGRHHHKHHGGSGADQAVKAAAGGNAPGNFDFYVISLSWAPGFCATPAGSKDPGECSPQRHFAFVLHGLWPQFEQNGSPENCSNETVDDAIVQSMLNIMPSPSLVKHEWSKHGTCSGLSPKEYFEEATDAFESIKIPSAYQKPATALTLSPGKITEDFVTSNQAFGEQGFTVACSSNGRYLQEVRACLTKDMEGRACNREVQQEACKSNQVILRPVR
jgi:ribonuclease T2